MSGILPLDDEEEGDGIAEAQLAHDAAVDHLVIEEEPLTLGGRPLDHMSLTTLTWLRRAGSAFATGAQVTDDEGIMRELGIFLLAHDSGKSVKERSRLLVPGEALTDAIETLLHTIPLRNAKALFADMMHYVTKETSTLATPDKTEGGEGNG